MRRFIKQSDYILKYYQKRMDGTYYSKIYPESPMYFIPKWDKNIEERLAHNSVLALHWESNLISMKTGKLSS